MSFLPWNSPFLAIFLAAATPLLSQGKPPAAPSPQRSAHASQDSKDDPGARQEATRIWFGGEPSVDYLDQKKAEARRQINLHPWSFPGWSGVLPAHATTTPGSSLAWTNLGPKAGSSYYTPPGSGDTDSGRLAIQGILTHPTNPQIIYLATAGGGVWKATNADLAASGDWNWTCITDNLPVATGTGNCAVGAIAMSPSDPETLLMGLGDHSDTKGRGLFKSTNGGASWMEITSLGNTTFITSILFVDANTILVGGNDGIWRSTNGGSTFSQLSGSATKVVWSFAKLAGNDVVCSFTDAGTTNGKILYSSDGGALFKVATGNTDSGRITLATSAASGTIVYGIEMDNSAPSNGSNFFVGVLKSLDKGATWAYLPAPVAAGSLFQCVGTRGTTDGGQASYNHILIADPSDPNRLFAASNLALFRSLDGGQSWQQMTHWIAEGRVYTHADFHTAAWSKAGVKTLFVGSDGGFTVVRDPYRAVIPSGATVPNPQAGFDQTATDPSFVDTRRNRGITSHLAYNVGSTAAANSRWRMSLALQDNSGRVRAAQGSSAFNDVSLIGDGIGTVWHPKDASRVIFVQYRVGTNGDRPGMKLSTDAGESFVRVGSTISDPQGSPFWTRIISGLGDPTGNTLLTATNRFVWVSPDFGVTWSKLNTTAFGANIRNIAASASNPQAFAIVAAGGQGAVSYDSGASWQVFGALPGVSTAGGGAGYVAPSYVWFDTSNANTLYVASASYTFAASHLWKSSNGGSSWTALDGAGSSFPNGPTHIIQNDPSNPAVLLAGTDYGLYRSDNGGSTWTRFGQGLPMVAVRDFYIAPDGKFIRAATFGRGIWEIGDSSEQGGGSTTTQLLQNPGFEGGIPPWVQSSADIITPSSTSGMQVHGGSNGAWLLGYGAAASQSLYQQVAITPGASAVTLKFWLFIGSLETGTTANDTLKVQVRSAAGTLLQTLATYSNLDPKGSWLQKTFDLTAYTGQTIRVHLEGAENASLVTSFFLDDFELNATVSTASAPSLTSFAPASGGVGTAVTLTGTGFTGATSVKFNGVPATSFSVVSDASITTAVPAGASSGTISVTTPAGTGTSSAPFTISAPAPVISAFSASPAVFTTGASVMLAWTVSGATSLSIDNGVGDVTALTSRQVAPTGASDVTYTLTATNAGGSSTRSVVVSYRSKDLNGDGTADLLDLAVLARAFGSRPGDAHWNAAADLNGDGVVDQADIDLFYQLAGF